MKLWLTVYIACFFIFATANATDLAKVRWQPLPGTVALTFDDGPSRIYTPEVLAILKRNHIKATFFVMSWAAKRYPDLVKQMIADGHAVALHTNSHPKLPKLTDKQLYPEVDIPKKVVGEIIGKIPVCLRPPYGLTNARINAYIRARELIPVPMGFNSFDYERRGTEKLRAWVIKNAVKGRVFLLHDGYDKREQTVAALPGIIEGIRQKGLGFSAICYPNPT